jgi:hypothetical protein
MSLTATSRPHPLRRASDRAPAVRRKERAVGLAWFIAMSIMVGLAGPLFVAFFALGVVSALGLKWLVIPA